VSPDRWEALERIFAEARPLEGSARQAFVTRACGDDLTLRREVLELLSVETPAEFLSQPALDRLARSIAADGWSLRPGERLGAYTVVHLLGAGGAGEVWRARDERLRRDVAIKILLPLFSADPAHLHRFMEEARTAGALNHPNILTVYDVGEHHGIPYLVTECLEGGSLRHRLHDGALPAEQTVTVALAIARGLAGAHARGIVHRDLKPENTFVTSDGPVKILDFGLATLQSAFADAPSGKAGSIEGEDHAATAPRAGTAGYMAPEQIAGEAVDARADLFALGVMLYEMLSGRHPFKGRSTLETLHAVMFTEPPDVGSLGVQVPEPLARVTMRLLRKAPEQRFQSAIDLIWALEPAVIAPANGRDPGGQPIGTRSRWRQYAPAIAAAMFAALALAGAWRWRSQSPAAPDPRGVISFTAELPAGISLDSAPAVSPSGRLIAFTGRDGRGSRLFVRNLAARDAVAIAGTEGAMQPFWSPDNAAIGFFANQRLMKVAWPDGSPVMVAPAPQARGGTWGPDGFITFAPDVILSGLNRVSAEGGDVTSATVIDGERGDTSHWWPAVLPDGRHFLYAVRSVHDERLGVYLGRYDRPAVPSAQPLFRTHSDVVYVPIAGSRDGALFSVADGRIEVRRFLAQTMTVASDARVLGIPAAGGTLYHPALVGASAEVLALAESQVSGGNRLEVVTRQGDRVRLWDEPEAQNWPRVSPDGRRLARQRVDGLRNNPDVWVDDLERGTRVRVTTGAEPDIQPVWSPDGRHLAYVTGHLPGRPGQRTLRVAAADGTGITRSFPCPGVYCEPTDWSPDGRELLVNVRDGGASAVWRVSAIDGGPVQPLVTGGAIERDARFSPNGRWVAYVSAESGRSELSVRPLTGPPTRIVLSGQGGAQAVWRRDGAELFFVNPQGRLQSVRVRWSADGTPTFGLPVEMNVPPIGFGHWGTQYDVSPDGQHIYLLRRNDDPSPRAIRVVIGWPALLE
jgi:Tol biopolymer transport system component